MTEEVTAPRGAGWRGMFSKKPAGNEETSAENGAEGQVKSRWNMGMLNDKETIEVPGSVLLLTKGRNEPLGLRNAPARTSHSSLPTGMPHQPPPPEEDKKKTKDGQFILDPQPDDSHNDPLNWASWRRDTALLCLGLYCMIGGGITPLIAAGFTNVAQDYGIATSQVSLTTGLYMMGLGIGSVIFSPTAILFGKRPVYLFSSIIFVLSAIWCALSPSFTSLLLARIFQGIAVSPVECLPSATIAEIFFLHERAFRIGIYTLLLLGGKNLIPLISAVIIQNLSWRWVFWIVAMVVGFSGILLFFFVPETFWDRTPVPKSRRPSRRPSFFSRKSSRNVVPQVAHPVDHGATDDASHPNGRQEPSNELEDASQPVHHHRHKNIHVGFAGDVGHEPGTAAGPNDTKGIEFNKKSQDTNPRAPGSRGTDATWPSIQSVEESNEGPVSPVSPTHLGVPTPEPPTPNSPTHEIAASSEYFPGPVDLEMQHHGQRYLSPETPNGGSEKFSIGHISPKSGGQQYTHDLRSAPAKSFSQQLQVYHGRLNNDKWWRVALRPFILYAYPAVLWSAAIYACSIGWLIVISESVAIIYRQGSYKFSALSTGLVYLSPFIGGILGTAVAGRVSDLVVKAMARRNGGLYEPEFRLVMAAPIAVTTVIGLMGFGWSAEVHDHWIVPTIFFGIVSFGCSLGSTTSITFCVDSYRQYAGEALVTLNFSKNILHGLVWSLFVTEWLTTDGYRSVYVWIGIIQLIVLLFTIPMYIYGKRMRMWTVRKNLMEKF